MVTRKKTTTRKKSAEASKAEEETAAPEDEAQASVEEGGDARQPVEAAPAAADSEPTLADDGSAAAGEAAAAQFDELGEGAEGSPDPRNLSLVMEIPVTCSVELGRTRIRIGELLKLSRGSVIDVERPAGDPLDLRVNGCLVARGEVVVVNDKFGIRLLDIVDRAERLKSVS